MFRPVVAIIILSFDSLKIILYNSRGGVFDEVHPHTQYRGTMLQQVFWCWDLLIKHAATRIV